MTDMMTHQSGANGEALPPLSEDLLHGAKAISTFMFGNDEDKNVRRVYHAAAKLGLPNFSIGNTICARRSTILKWIARQEAA